MREKPATLSDQLRGLIEASGVSRYRISQETGITEATLSRFMSGKGGLSTKGQDAIGLLLGLKLIARDKPKLRKQTTRRSSQAKGA